jgi:hypothetical protein
MSMNTELVRAILSMDAYNRGYNSGVAGLSDVIGTAIGTATISRVTLSTDTDAVNAGFYAIAYTLPSGEKVISYRGTDGLFGTDAPNIPSGSDLYNGYGVGAGSPFGPQAQLAVDFYKAVAGTDPRTANVSLTGHSLGGGLAGW